MSKEKHILFDFDDTLSDQVPFVLQFSRELGSLLASRFGGEGDVWTHHTLAMLIDIENEYNARFIGNPLAGYGEWLNALKSETTTRLFHELGLEPPLDGYELFQDLQFRALSRCNHTFSGVNEALGTLKSRGYRLHVASGQESQFLLGGLTGAGIDGFIEHRFGPDLIDCAKEGADYYRRIYDVLGVKPEQTLIVDDYPPAIGWALEVGAVVIQAKLSKERHFDIVPGVAGVVEDMSKLPNLVESLFPG